MAQLKNTDIAGNLTVNSTLTNNGVDLLARVNSDYTKIYNMFCKAPALTYSVAPGTNYKTSAGAFTDLRGSSVYLLGNRLTIYLYAVRNSTPSAGNITNETVGTFTISHGGKIKSLYNATSLTYRYGDLNSFYTDVDYVDDNTLTVKINLSACRAANKYIASHHALTVELNPDAF
jgi:hypothetical protein